MPSRISPAMRLSRMPAATRRAYTPVAARAGRAEAASSPAGGASMFVVTGRETSILRSLFFEQAMDEGALLVQPLQLARKPIYLALERGEPALGGGVDIPALQARRERAADLRIQDHRDQRDQQRDEQNDKDQTHERPKYSGVVAACKNVPTSAALRTGPRHDGVRREIHDRGNGADQLRAVARHVRQWIQHALLRSPFRIQVRRRFAQLLD